MRKYKEFQKANTEKLMFYIDELEIELIRVKSPEVLLLNSYIDSKLICIEQRKKIIWGFFQNNKDKILLEHQRKIEEMFLNVV